MYDGVGEDTFERSIGCTQPFGYMVNYGNASGHVPPFELLKLAAKSITISRPGFSSYARDIPRMRAGAAELFELVKRGIIAIEIGRTYPLKDAAEAHRDLEGRKSAGSILLVP